MNIMEISSEIGTDNLSRDSKRFQPEQEVESEFGHLSAELAASPDLVYPLTELPRTIFLKMILACVRPFLFLILQPFSNIFLFLFLILFLLHDLHFYLLLSLLSNTLDIKIFFDISPIFHSKHMPYIFHLRKLFFLDFLLDFLRELIQYQNLSYSDFCFSFP